MCGRFDVDARDPQIRELAAKLSSPGMAVKLGEVFPGNLAMGITPENGVAAVRPFHWGFPKKESKGLIINARAESALQKPMFAAALKKHPIAIPATGFYEWRPNPETMRKDKFLFSIPNEDVFYLAAFARLFEDGSAPEAFVILTTEANASMLPYHHRMPVLLTAQEVDVWLKGERAGDFFNRPQPGLEVASI